MTQDGPTRDTPPPPDRAQLMAHVESSHVRGNL